MEVVSSLLVDEREDGEIVDDEDVDFEEISDYSMPSCGGKSDYSRNIIRAISLSSISGDSDDRDSEDQKNKFYFPTKKRRRHGRVHIHKRRRRISISSSSEDEKLDSRTLKQLKEAVRINVSDEFHHNSLRTRLKGMIDPDSQDEECLRTMALITQSNDKPKNEENEIHDNEKDDHDKELSELRLEALKSAFLKKYIERKRRKEINDKENEEHKKVEENVDIEEDVDVMRAMLLASMSKKITELPPSSTPIVQKHLPSKPTFIVKPLIINLNSDSDSDSDNNNKTQQNPKISENVTALLRKQREEFEAKEEAKEEALLDKSVVKLLSKAQQKEYQLLQEKLLQAKNLQVKKLLNGVHNNKDATSKKKSLLDLQVQKDGRFQMKGKYKELAPLKKLVDQANLVRKQQDEKTKRLLKELNEAKLKLASDHKMYSNMVQKLLKAKENIDKRTNVNKIELKAPLVENTEAKNVPVEVTPPVDKNAIDTTNEVSKYVSPLDHREIKQPNANPLEFLCPYELFGVCRDKDCNFNHCT
ncbi:PREDICTED: myb-like protein X isoform X2 [Nicrophorus vespilloides]|nr:PREDICTED: myb-like protein X isoform X2 [Nicrophorus vespilloides]XP_017783211.1 PREDICTED: myb-like protein X isoform X2 [Nicrophorus vespilloides]